MKTLLKDSNGGIGIALSVAFMAFSLVLISGALTLASTLARDSGVKTRLMKSQYSLLGGVEYALYRLTYEPDYVTDLIEGGPDTQEITLNGELVTIITEYDPADEDPPGFPPPNAMANRRVQTSKTVTPTTADPLVMAEFTYTITVENREREPWTGNHIRDCLPTGFAYVPGSTSGVTTDEPGTPGGCLDWNVSVTLDPGESASLVFQASASVDTGNYCNEAYVTPGGESNTTSRKTAMVKVGTPPDDLCQGKAIDVQKVVTPNVVGAHVERTFTYTISVINYGTESIDVMNIQDTLPESFSYLAASTTGDFTTSDPDIVLKTVEGVERQELTWRFNPKFALDPGQTAQLRFEAMATLEPGVYWNETTVKAQNLPDTYSWPTAPVAVAGRYLLTVTSGGLTYTAIVWSDGSQYLISEWEITD